MAKKDSQPKPSTPPTPPPTPDPPVEHHGIDCVDVELELLKRTAELDTRTSVIEEEVRHVEERQHEIIERQDATLEEWRKSQDKAGERRIETERRFGKIELMQAQILEKVEHQDECVDDVKKGVEDLSERVTKATVESSKRHLCGVIVMVLVMVMIAVFTAGSSWMLERVSSAWNGM